MRWHRMFENESLPLFSVRRMCGLILWHTDRLRMMWRISFLFLISLTIWFSCVTKTFSLFVEQKDIVMKTLTGKEEEVMGFFWEKGPLFVRQIVELYEEPRPHFNTLSTIVRGLEEKGYLSHTAFGNTYRYFPVVSREEFKRRTLKGVISKYFNNSYLDVVSSLVKEEELSLDELKELVRRVEEADREKERKLLLSDKNIANE